MPNIKPFFISAVIASAIKTGLANETEPKKRGSMPTCWPVPVSFIEKTLGVCKPTAIDYMKIARKSNYLNMYLNQEEVINLTPFDIRHLRLSDVETIKIQLIGHENYKKVPISHLRTWKGKVLVQGVNFYKSNLTLGNRRLTS
ncbi:MAG: hypothetical protein WD035_03060 [Balneolaceae bacterium]